MRQTKDFYARFQRIVSFIVAGKARQYYKTVQQYVLALALKSKSPNHPSLRLRVPRQILDKLSRTRDGRHHLREFAARMSPFMRYHPHVVKKFPSGKTFERASWFEPDEKWLRQAFEKGLSGLLTAEDRKWLARRLDKPVLGSSSMTDDKPAGLNPETIQAIPRELRKQEQNHDEIGEGTAEEGMRDGASRRQLRSPAEDGTAEGAQTGEAREDRREERLEGTARGEREAEGGAGHVQDGVQGVPVRDRRADGQAPQDDAPGDGDVPETGGEVLVYGLTQDVPPTCPPPDDLPEEAPGLDWTLKDVQLAVDKNVLSLTTARHVASVIGLDGLELRDSPTGYCWEDERRNYLTRAKVVHKALEAYAPSKSMWLEDDRRAQSYRILEGLARDIVRTLKSGCP